MLPLLSRSNLLNPARNWTISCLRWISMRERNSSKVINPSSLWDRVFCIARTSSGAASEPRKSRTCFSSMMSIVPELSSSNLKNTSLNRDMSLELNWITRLSSNFFSSSASRSSSFWWARSSSFMASTPSMRSSTFTGLNTSGDGFFFLLPSAGKSLHHNVARILAASRSRRLLLRSSSFTSFANLGLCRHRKAATAARMARMSRLFPLKSTPSLMFPRTVRKMITFFAK
mmetsp:Transcript_5967/g.14200  ORF Transcript_5967/g.14200 Transcript_5967/m.14200 type:complete len:230 (+) Transcript_5967:2291-2980(+)